MNVENVVRKKSIKRIVLFICIFFFSLFVLEMFFAYQYLCYMAANKSSGTGFADFALATMNMRFTLLFTIDTIKAMFRCVLSVWWLNGIILLLLLLSIRKAGSFKNMEYGSARWATKQERRKYDTSEPDGYIPIAKNIYIHPKQNDLNNLNEIVLGGSGSGKSFTKIIPDIMCQFGSYIITDVKGDLYKYLFKILGTNGYKVRVLNLENLKYSNTFNPILYCQEDTDIDKLVNTFVINSRREGTNAGEGFWEDTLSMLLFAAIRYITQTPTEEKTFYRCLQLAASIELVNGKISPYCEIERLMTELELQDTYSSAVLNWKLVKQAPAETLQSVIISLTSRLRLWANEDLRIMTQTDEMQFDKLAEEKTAIFLIVPEGDSTYNCISSMFIATAMQRLKSLAKTKYNGSLPRLVSLELDEFANTGILPDWAASVSTIRSQNIRAMMVLQDLQQLKKNYDKSEKTIMSNCAIFNYLGSSDQDTLKLVAEKLGKTTIQERNISYQNAIGGTEKGSISERNLGRGLMTKDEIEHKPKNKCIVFFDDCYPIYADKYNTAQHKLFSLLGFKSGKAVVNNTDIIATYQDIYAVHKAEYQTMRKRQDVKVSLFDDVGTERQQDILKPEQLEPKQADIKQEFERKFLKDLKKINL